MNVIKRKDHDVASYINDLVNSGRKYVKNHKVECRYQVMSECERHELAGHMLMEMYDNGDDVLEIFASIIDNYDISIVRLSALFCITNSNDNAAKLTDEILAAISNYFEEHMQLLLDEAWEQLELEKSREGMEPYTCDQTGETLWRRSPYA